MAWQGPVHATLITPNFEKFYFIKTYLQYKRQLQSYRDIRAIDFV